ncbi:MAG: LamG domain-containing protein [Ignavibacteriales bacterium]|nr:LamG domain-containing protein [Ignavibacteriales bacterium]
MQNLDIFLIEEKFRKIHKSIKSDNYSSEQLFKLVAFFDELFQNGDSLLVEAYIAESYNILFSLLEHYSPFGKPFDESTRILVILEKIESHFNYTKWRNEYSALLNRVKKEQIELKEFLDGKILEDNYSNKIAFPLIENPKNNNNYGAIDTFNILLSPDKKLIDDEFSIIPSLPKLDYKIENQLLNSWNYAKNFLLIENHSKTPKFKVVIEYDKRIGFYTGDSNGIALTLGFIIELAKYLNLQKIYKINENALFTGLVDRQGVIGEVSKEVIEKKIKTAFYSNYHLIVIPQNDYLDAEKALISEKNKYPKRAIKLVPVNNINEVFSSPSISKIVKIDPLKFYLTEFKKNKVVLYTSTLLLISLLYISLGYSFNFKNNHIIENEDFLEYAQAELGFDESKLSPLNYMGEIINLKFDSSDLDTNKFSKIIDFKNIELVRNRFNEPEKAFRFNGKNSFIQLRNKEKLKIDFPISISVWIKKRDKDYGWIFTNNFDTKKYYGVFLGFISRNILSLHFGNGNVLGSLKSRKSIYTKEVLPLDTWNHIIGILYSKDSLSLYVNSKKMDSYYSGDVGEIKYNDGPVYFGKYNNSKILPIPYYKGDMDDFRIFNKVLSEKEIDLLFYEK